MHDALLLEQDKGINVIFHTEQSDMLASYVVHMDACGLLAVMNRHFNASSCVTVLSAICPASVLSIGQHSIATALSSLITT